MPKATLEFDLDNKDEKLAFKRTIGVDNVYLALHEISNKLSNSWRSRSLDKQDHVAKCISKAVSADCKIQDHEIGDFEEDVVSSAISALQVQFYTILEELGVDLDDLP